MAGAVITHFEQNRLEKGKNLKFIAAACASKEVLILPSAASCTRTKCSWICFLCTDIPIVEAIFSLTAVVLTTYNAQVSSTVRTDVY